MSGREHGHDGTLPHAASPAAHLAPPASNSNDELEVVPGFDRENLQGWIPSLATESDIRAVIEKAFDYRGDVTITRKDGSEITGYLFDRRIGKTLNDSAIRLMLSTSNHRTAISYSEIAGIAFTGRDTAAGKSYEAWVKKYWEKRENGEKNISIEPEALE
ncbi:MAG TPA: hypothetical protein VL983_06140 [Terriglobales bacterium]|nr:hypothetical protein [Terriglobales bacterium]